MRLWYFSSSVSSFFKRARTAIQLSYMSDVWSDISSTLIFHVCEQRRLRRDCADGRLCDQCHNLMSWLIYVCSYSVSNSTVGVNMPCSNDMALLHQPVFNFSALTIVNNNSETWTKSERLRYLVICLTNKLIVYPTVVCTRFKCNSGVNMR